MSQSIHEYWARSLQQIAAWAEPDESDTLARFGHIQISPAHFISERTKIILSQMLSRSSAKPFTLFIGSVLEKNAANTELHPSCHTMTWQQAIRLFEQNRGQTSEGEGYWELQGNSDDWEQGRILPAQVIIVFSVEPRMPAECVLCLIIATRWALDVSRRKDSFVRVLTVSPPTHQDSMRRLFEAFGGGKFYEIAQFNLEDPKDADPLGNVPVMCMDSGAIIHRVVQDIKAHPTGKHAILSFPMWDCIYGIEDILTAEAPELSVATSELDKQDCLGELRQVFFHPSGDVNSLLMTPGFRSPMPIEGYSHLHLILREIRYEEVYDHKTGQVTLMDLPISREEREEQLSWAYRVAPDTQLCVYTTAASIQDYLAAGHSFPRLKIENKEVGGFISSVCGFAPIFGFDPRAALACFLRFQHVKQEMNDRLCLQGILSSSPSRSLSFGLLGRQGELYLKVLPCVKYDHRVAHFLSVLSRDVEIMQVKIQLSAIMTVGLTDLIYVNPNLKDTWKHCWGYTCPLSRAGTLWLLLGLWKRGLKDYKSLAEQSLEKYPFLDGSAELFGDTARMVLSLIKMITEVFRDCNLDIPVSNIEKETGELAPDQCYELQRDLFHSFLFQLLTVHPVEGDESGNREPELVDLLSGHTLSGTNIGSRLGVDVGVCMATEKVPTCLFGIYSLATRDGANRGSVGWNYIPTQIVADWLSKHGHGASIHEVLEGLPRPLKNLDE